MNPFQAKNFNDIKNNNQNNNDQLGKNRHMDTKVILFLYLLNYLYLFQPS